MATTCCPSILIRLSAGTIWWWKDRDDDDNDEHIRIRHVSTMFRYTRQAKMATSGSGFVSGLPSVMVKLRRICGSPLRSAAFSGPLEASWVWWIGSSPILRAGAGGALHGLKGKGCWIRSWTSHSSINIMKHVKMRQRLALQLYGKIVYDVCALFNAI